MENYEEMPALVKYLKKREMQIAHSIADMSDKERSECNLLHQYWNPYSHYVPDNVVLRGEILYKCLIEHDAQESWKPEDSPSLWSQIMYRDGIRIIEENIPAENPFNEGDLGWWGDLLYRSILPGANVYNPEQYPAGWELVVQEEPERDIPDEPIEDEQIKEPELGTIDNPIPFGLGMNVIEGTYYIFEDMIYLAKADMNACSWYPGTAGMWQWEAIK